MWWIAREGHRIACFLGRLNVGHQQVLNADVEQAFEGHHVVPWRTHDRRSSAALHGLQLRQNFADVVGRMFHVQQQPVVAAMGQDFNADGAAQM